MYKKLVLKYILKLYMVHYEQYSYYLFMWNDTNILELLESFQWEIRFILMVALEKFWNGYWQKLSENILVKLFAVKRLPFPYNCS